MSEKFDREVQVSGDAELHESGTDHMEKKNEFEMWSWGGRGRFADTIGWKKVKEKEESKIMGFSYLAQEIGSIYWDK